MEKIVNTDIFIPKFKYISIEKLYIKKAIDKHSTAEVVLFIDDAIKDKTLDDIKEDTIVEIMAKDKMLFCGLINDIKVFEKKGKEKLDYYIGMKLVSISSKMDEVKRKRTYQKYPTYKSIFDEIEKNYKSGSGKLFKFGDSETNSKTPNELVVQYNETDWEFFQRIISKEEKKVSIRDDSLTDIMIWPGYKDEKKAGTPDKLTVLDYSLKRDENKKFEIKFKHHKIFNVGDKIDKDLIGGSGKLTISGIDHYTVKEAVFRMDYDSGSDFDNIMNFKSGRTSYSADILDNIRNNSYWNKMAMTTGHYDVTMEYIVCDAKSETKKAIKNNNIAGLGLEAKVLKCEKDKVKVEFLIDTIESRKQEEGKAVLIPYCTPYSSENSTGIYMMPEIGDTVLVNFPTSDENKPIVLASIRKGAISGKSASAPDKNKFFRTAKEKEMEMSDTGILISASKKADGAALINMSAKGIEMLSGSDISISAKEELNIYSGKSITISGQQKVAMTVGASSYIFGMAGVHYDSPQTYIDEKEKGKIPEAKKEEEKSKSAGASAAKTPEQPKAPAVEKKEAEKVAGSEKREEKTAKETEKPKVEEKKDIKGYLLKVKVEGIEKQIQRCLKAIGFDLNDSKCTTCEAYSKDTKDYKCSKGFKCIDGVFGVKSASALIVYQNYAKVKVTGLPDKTTIDSLLKNFDIKPDGDRTIGTQKISRDACMSGWQPIAPGIVFEGDNKGNASKEQLEKYFTVLPTMEKINAPLETNAAVGWAHMIQGALDYNIANAIKLDIDRFVPKGDVSCYRDYDGQLYFWIGYVLYKNGKIQETYNLAAEPIFANTKVVDKDGNAKKNVKGKDIERTAEEVVVEWYKQYCVKGGNNWKTKYKEFLETELKGVGKSNHGIGVSIDMNLPNISKIRRTDITEAGKEREWLENNGGKYGFTALIKLISSEGENPLADYNGKSGFWYAEVWHFDYYKYWTMKFKTKTGTEYTGKDCLNKDLRDKILK